MAVSIFKNINSYFIMFVIPKLYVNAFIDVRIPSNTDLYLQYGFKSLSHRGNSDGNFAEPVNVVGNKISDLARGASEFNQMYSDFVESEARKNEPANDDKRNDDVKPDITEPANQPAS